MKNLLIYILIFTFTISQASEHQIEAITEPSKDVSLNFLISGIIKSIHVKEGQAIKKDQLLMKLDDRSEKLRIEKLQAEAADLSLVKLTKLDLEHKRKELSKLESLYKSKAIPKRDYDMAKFEYESAKVTVELRENENKVKQIEAKTAEDNLKLYSLSSPLSGIIEELKISEGETTKEDSIIRIIKIDPLWIDVPVSHAFSTQLKVKDQVKVKFENAKVVNATISHKSSVGDAASRTVLVRIEVENPTLRPAGERVQVIFDKQK